MQQSAAGPPFRAGAGSFSRGGIGLRGTPNFRIIGCSFQLEVRSEIGEGTTVTMRIPLLNAAESQLCFHFERIVGVTPGQFRASKIT